MRNTFLYLSITLSILLSPFLSVAFEREDSALSLIKLDTIHNLPLSHPEGTLFLFDVDDTLTDSPHMIGSRAWRRYLQRMTTPYWYENLTLFVITNIPAAPVETATPDIIKELQDKGHVVCGFTARARGSWFDIPGQQIDRLTLSQLATAGIFLDADSFQKTYPSLVGIPEYYEGIFFADSETKGEYLTKLLEVLSSTSQLPRKIVFIDDKRQQVESVAVTLKEWDIDHECYWYCATDEKANRFNPAISNIQLYHLWYSQGITILSDQEAAEFTQHCPDIALRAVLDNCKEVINE